MFKQKIIRRLLLIISFILLITSTVNTTFGFVVAKTDTLINYFKPFEKIVNSLTISKTVEHPFEDGYIIPENISFDFKVELGSLYANTTLETTAGEVKADESGALTLSVKPHQWVTIEGIDSDTRVTVTEIDNNAPGFSVKNGESVKEVVISEGAVAEVEFVNVYAPEAVRADNITVTGRKELSGRDWQEGDSFFFLLEQNVDGKWQELGKESVIYVEGKKEFNKFDFTKYIKNLTFSKAGDYKFRMTEVMGNLENMDYDKTVNTFTVKVTDRDMDGRLEIGNVESAQNAATVSTDTGFAVDVVFSNTFKPPVAYNDITVPITVNKTVVNKGAYKRSAEDFEFILEDKFGNKKSFKSDKDGVAVTDITVTESDIGDTLEYKVYEKNGGEKGVTYDTYVYTLAITISTEEENKLKADLTVNSEETEEIKLSFENICDMDKPSVPDTGDNKVYWWLLLALLSGSACVPLLVAERKYRGM